MTMRDRERGKIERKTWGEENGTKQGETKHEKSIMLKAGR